MYVEEIKAQRKGRKYSTFLVRESYREGSKVNHRTLANISNLPLGCIEEIKKYLKGIAGGLDFSKLRLTQSKEYGASQALLSFSRSLRLDYTINPKKTFWREEVLGLLASKLIYPNHSLSLTKGNPDTMLWQLCRYTGDIKDDQMPPLDVTIEELMANRQAIQKRLAKKHAAGSKAVFCYLLQEDVYKSLNDTATADSFFDHSLIVEPVVTALWTNQDGCPWTVESFRHDAKEGLQFQEDTHSVLKSLQPERVIVIGERHVLTEKNLESMSSAKFSTIVPSSPIQVGQLIEKHPHLIEDVSTEWPREVQDTDNPAARYILCLDPSRRRSKLAASSEKGGLEDQARKDSREDFVRGLFVLRTDVPKEEMSAEEIIAAYRKLFPIKLFKFANDDFIDTDLQLKNDEDYGLRSFLNMLSYYLMWQVEKKLETLAKSSEQGFQKALKGWEAIEKLKGLRCQTVQIESIVIKEVKNMMDEEQAKIISCLGVSI